MPTRDGGPLPNFSLDDRACLLPVPPLDEAASRQLFTDRTGQERVDFGIESWIIEQAGGVPGILLAAARFGGQRMRRRRSRPISIPSTVASPTPDCGSASYSRPIGKVPPKWRGRNRIGTSTDSGGIVAGEDRLQCHHQLTEEAACWCFPARRRAGLDSHRLCGRSDRSEFGSERVA